MASKTSEKNTQNKGYRFVRNAALITFFIYLAFFTAYIAKPEKMQFIYQLEMVLYDAQVKMLPDEKPSDRFSVAEADDKALQKYGRWPWDRSVIADFIDNVMQKGAKGVIFDMTFSERINQSLETKIKELDPNWVSGEEKLRQVLEKYGKKVVLGTILQSSDEYINKEELNGNVKAAMNKSSFFYAPVEPSMKNKYPISSGWAGIVLPLPELMNTPANMAFFNTKSDLDGPIRRYLLVNGIKLDTDTWVMLPSLSIAAAELYFEGITKIEYSSVGIERMSIGNHMIPTDYDGQIMINYYTKKDSFNHFSIADSQSADVKDKVVFVANTAVGTWDQRVTPLEDFVPGIFVHAAMISNILENRYLTSPLWSYFIAYIFVLIPLLFIKRLYEKVPLWMAISGSAVYSAAFFFTGYMAHKAGIVVYMMTPIIFLWLVMIITYIGKYFFVDKERGFIKSAFSKYLDPKLLNRLTGDSNQIKLYGEKKEIVALFSDIVGFTTLSEALAPEVLINSINRLFTPATAAVFEHNGFLDKYMGDAMMALYGAPIDIADKEKQACATAVKIIERMDVVRAEFKAEGKPDVRMGVGVNAGDAIVGNMGSEKRFNYSAIGDAVNTASRLEGLTRMYGARIIASEKIYDKAHDEFIFRKLDVVQVKGKHQGVAIYELFARADNPDRERLIKLKNDYESALEAFRSNKMDEAIALYEKSDFKDDFAFKFLIERAKELKESGEAYNGVWKFTSK